MEITTTYCDICEKEVHNNYTKINIKIGQERWWQHKGAFRYQNAYSFLVCYDCVGSKVTECDGSHGNFGIVDFGKSLLRRFKIIK